MNTVFSHIIQKRLSRETENIATEALTFIVESSEAARSGLMSLLRAVEPDLPDLRFSTQKSEGSSRPDMHGMDGNTPRVFIENKFWAGLTENQPAEYLRRLADYGEPAVMLVVAPEARQETIWRELCRRLDADPTRSSAAALPGIHGILQTETGPRLALTSWTSLLAEIEVKLKDQPRTRNDLDQLRALCGSADNQAFIPLSSAELTDQRLPALILESRSVVEAAVQVCVSEGILSLRGLRPQADDTRMGRYIQFLAGVNPCPWIGVDLELWRKHGETPLWLEFSSQAGKAHQIRGVVEPWADRRGLPTGTKSGVFPLSVGLRLATGEEKDEVVRSLVDTLRSIAAELTPSRDQKE
jgi:hypothetical protein